MFKISQQTISELENEILHYHHQQNIDKKTYRYENAARMLQNRISELSIRLQTEIRGKMSLEESKQLCEQKLVSFDKKYKILMIEHGHVMKDMKRTEVILRENRQEIDRLKNERDEYEKRYRIISEVHSHCRTRESISHVKIGEALCLAEAAIGEKKAAENKKKELREEFDRLAANIGNVLEEAGTQFEVNVEKLKLNYKEELTLMDDFLKKVYSFYSNA